MKYVLVSIKDRAVEAFQPAYTARAEGEAIRGFQDAINNQQSGTIHTHPEDFDLYILAYIDDQTGRIEPLDDPRKIADGKTLGQLNRE